MNNSHDHHRFLNDVPDDQGGLTMPTDRSETIACQLAWCRKPATQVYQDDMDGPIHLCDEHMLMLQREDEIENAGHRMGVEQVYWDNLGGGWRMDCLCGWTTVPCDQLVGAAEEMELHWELERSGG